MFMDILTKWRRNIKYGALTSKAASSLTFCADVMATRKAVLKIKLGSHEAAASKGHQMRHRSAKDMSQGCMWCLIGGYKCIRPLRNRFIKGWEKSEWSSIGSWKVETAARYTHNDKWERPRSKRDNKKSNTIGNPTMIGEQWVVGTKSKKLHHLY